MIYESTRKMTPDEQMAFDMGYAKAKEEYADALAKAEKQAEAAIETIKRSKPCEHCAHFADGKYCNYCDDQCCNFKWRDPTEQEESE